MKKAKKVRITLTLPDELVEWLTNEAKRRGISRSALVELILREYLATVEARAVPSSPRTAKARSGTRKKDPPRQSTRRTRRP